LLSLSISNAPDLFGRFLRHCSLQHCVLVAIVNSSECNILCTCHQSFQGPRAAGGMLAS